MTHQVNETDFLWTNVENYAYGNLFPPTTDFRQALDRALQHQRDSGLPDIAVSPLEGSFLALQTRLLGSKRVLEVGTLGGYSTIWFAHSEVVEKVTTVDVEPKHTQVARENVKNAGLADKVEFITDSGLNALKKLQQEVSSGTRPPFDFVFIDADKVNNLNYLELALEMTVVGAAIVIDNIVKAGAIADSELAKTDDIVRASRDCFEAAGRSDRLDVTIVQTVGLKSYDGILIGRKVK